ncbi:MAG: hypothetical protein ORN52_07000 [Beijerinckiaceae bacterium]|jgi:hypothetical protein|nr:hypothetical protein [Beijerinckiaceae bacterium]
MVLIRTLLELLKGTGGNAGILVDLSEGIEEGDSDDPDGALNSRADG